MMGMSYFFKNLNGFRGVIIFFKEKEQEIKRISEIEYLIIGSVITFVIEKIVHMHDLNYDLRLRMT